MVELESYGLREESGNVDEDATSRYIEQLIGQIPTTEDVVTSALNGRTRRKLPNSTMFAYGSAVAD